MTDQTRLWAYLELPVPLEDVCDLGRWVAIQGDPVQLLEEALPFIGWPGAPDDLKARIYAVVDAAKG